MSREWKPGDVAMVSGIDREVESVAINIEGTCWHSVREDGDLRCTSTDAASARPLVVIDPEDAEQVEKLRHEIFMKTGVGHREFDRVQAALREYADPTPKIEEPMGLGAVVEDNQGRAWVRAGGEAGDSMPWLRDVDGTGWRTWSRIDAVRVLSHGIAPGEDS